MVYFQAGIRRHTQLLFRVQHKYPALYEDILSYLQRTSFLATNIAETRKFSIETPDVSIKVNPDRTDLVETKMIDGKQCLVIEINDQVEVNGVPVRTLPIGTVE